MQVKLIACFEISSINGSELASIISEFLKFEPQIITINHQAKAWKNIEDILRKWDKGIINSLFIEEREGNNYFSVSRAGRTLDFISITINSNSKIFYPTDNQIVSLALKKGFISAYLVDSDYEFVQTEKFSNKFKGKSIPQKILDSIKNTPAKPEMWGGMEYNTKFNPGRSILLTKTWLSVGWKMWFGDAFFNIVDKNRIQSFTHAIDLRNISDHLIFIQLYESCEEPYAPDAIFRQWKWREWIDYDDLETRMS